LTKVFNSVIFKTWRCLRRVPNLWGQYAVSTFKNGLLGAAAIAALVSLGTSVGANAATITDPATTFLSTLTISGVSPSGATIVGSVYDTDFGNFGAGTVETFLHTYFGGTITQIGGGDCPANCSQSGSGSNNGATYSGVASQLFAIHWGGGSSDQPFLGIEFSVAVTNFAISGFAHGVSFIRSYNGETTTGGGGDNPTPLPAALPLFASGLGALGLLGWRRKRKAQAAA
jgi:hypothetical protein